MKAKILFFVVAGFICVLSLKAQLPPDTVPRPHDTIPYPWKDTSFNSLRKKQAPVKGQSKKEEKTVAPDGTLAPDQKKKKPK
jgi:hypothetical protein